MPDSSDDIPVELYPLGTKPLDLSTIPSTKIGQFETLRPQIIKDTVDETYQQYASQPLDPLLEASLFYERSRLKREHFNPFTYHRKRADQDIWSLVGRSLLKSPSEVDRKRLLEKVVHHYADEVGGHFSSKVYKFATVAVPHGFNWLLNAAGVKQFNPFGQMQLKLSERIRILGDVKWVQNLSKKGTVMIVPTHQSNIDSILLGYVIYLMGLPPFSYGAGLNLFSNPILKFFMSNLGGYTIDRKKKDPIYKDVLRAYSTRILREGIHSIFFPGGGRSRSGAIESSIKLGLLGTALEAEVRNLREKRENPRVFIVPMVMCYHFVLEASSLVDDHLLEEAKTRLVLRRDESFDPVKIARFFWRLFANQNEIFVRLGRPLDVFGNFVNEDGESLGPRGEVIDTSKWLKSEGQIRPVPQRDREYTRILGTKLVERYHRENLALTSHFAAMVYLETLRKKYPEYDLYRLLRLSIDQRSIPLSEFLTEAHYWHERISECAARGELHLTHQLHVLDTKSCIEDGLQKLGAFHDLKVLKIENDVVVSEDMPLLYYYRNRLTGYQFSSRFGLSRGSLRTTPHGLIDEKGFLV